MTSNASTTTKSSSTNAARTTTTSAMSNTIALGAGCYWGTEKYIRRNFQARFPKSVRQTTVGFASPYSPEQLPWRRPTYQQVCTGRSGHIEVVLVELVEPKTLADLVRFFFQFHDPTTPNRQGNDWGLQYASFLFCSDAAQQAVCQRVIRELQALLDANQLPAGVYAKKRVTTYVVPLVEFIPAQSSHQRYLEKHPQGYCNHRLRFPEWPAITTIQVALDQHNDNNNDNNNNNDNDNDNNNNNKRDSPPPQSISQRPLPPIRPSFSERVLNAPRRWRWSTDRFRTNLLGPTV